MSEEKSPVAVDPVCGMPVETRDSRWTTRTGEATYHFCSLICKRTFDENVEKIVETEAERQWRIDHIAIAGDELGE